MKGRIDQIEAFDSKHHCLNVVVETPKGSPVKYAYDSESGFFTPSKILPASLVFPFNFGFIPGTQAEDGDPLDILLLNEASLVCGSLVHARPVAVIKIKQKEKNRWIRNDRIVGEAFGKESVLASLKLEKRTLTQIEFFFVTYNKFFGKELSILGTEGAAAAQKIVRRSIQSDPHH